MCLLTNRQTLKSFGVGAGVMSRCGCAWDRWESDCSLKRNKKAFKNQKTFWKIRKSIKSRSAFWKFKKTFINFSKFKSFLKETVSIWKKFRSFSKPLSKFFFSRKTFKKIFYFWQQTFVTFHPHKPPDLRKERVLLIVVCATAVSSRINLQ